MDKYTVLPAIVIASSSGGAVDKRKPERRSNLLVDIGYALVLKVPHNAHKEYKEFKEIALAHKMLAV